MTQHYAMLKRDLLYKGITRGKRLVVLVGQKKASLSRFAISRAGDAGPTAAYLHATVPL